MLGNLSLGSPWLTFGGLIFFSRKHIQSVLALACTIFFKINLMFVVEFPIASWLVLTDSWSEQRSMSFWGLGVRLGT